MTKAVLITGAAGGIGSALTRAYAEAGWFVIATSRKTPEPAEHIGCFIAADLIDIARNDEALDMFADRVRTAAATAGAPLKALVNNAALQRLGGTEDLSREDFERSFAVNALAPFRLTQALLPDLEAEGGAILNIGTVHARATKKGFVAYATTKTALHGLTRALAVDLGGRVRVNCLAPAATETAMLKAGFADRPKAYQALAAAHPAGRIAAPDEVAQAALFLTADDCRFITGATLYCDGGVLSRLHDPL